MGHWERQYLAGRMIDAHVAVEDFNVASAQELTLDHLEDLRKHCNDEQGILYFPEGSRLDVLAGGVEQRHFFDDGMFMHVGNQIRMPIEGVPSQRKPVQISHVSDTWNMHTEKQGVEGVAMGIYQVTMPSFFAFWAPKKSA